jgi:tetratricopeptide (TPR) repeat protein
LVASSDLWFLAEPGQSSSVLHLARLAALSGTKVVLSPAAGQCDMAGSSGFTVMDFSAMALARLLKTFERRSDGPALLADPCPYARAAIEFDGIFSSLLVSTEHENQPVTSQTSAAPSWHDRLSILESPGMRQGTDEVLHEVEHLLLLAPPAGDIVSRLHACKGTALFAAGNLESATDAFRSALAALAGTPFEDASSKESQQASKCYKALAQIALAVHSYQEALDLFRRAHALYPADLETCSGIGAVYRKLDLHEEALHWLGRSVSEDRSSGINEAALVAFTQTLLACPDRPAAIRAVNQLTSIIGEHPMLEKALDSMADG